MIITEMHSTVLQLPLVQAQMESKAHELLVEAQLLKHRQLSEVLA